MKSNNKRGSANALSGKANTDAPSIIGGSMYQASQNSPTASPGPMLSCAMYAAQPISAAWGHTTSFAAAAKPKAHKVKLSGYTYKETYDLYNQQLHYARSHYTTAQLNAWQTDWNKYFTKYGMEIPAYAHKIEAKKGKSGKAQFAAHFVGSDSLTRISPWHDLPLYPNGPTP